MNTQMSEAIAIKSCSIRDVNSLVSLGIRTFRDTFGDVNTAENMRLYLSQTFTHEKVAAELSEPGSTFFIAVSGGVEVGYAKVRSSKIPEDLEGTPSMEIQRLYAIKDRIGKGVGRALMEACLQYARDHHFKTVWLGVWEHNTTAISFYERFGFVRFSQQEFMLGSDLQTDIMMKKEL